jgi:acetolactate synthase-1/2/3 large subunit
MPVLDVRNEQAAAYMADTWGRLTGTLGVVAVSSGPGHTNTITGLANAYWDGGPMLLISGCSPTHTRGFDHFQELDQVGLVKPVTKYASLVPTVGKLQHEVNTALSAALTGRPGPVHLTVPTDVLQAQVEESSLLNEDLPPARVEPQGAADTDQIRAAIQRLSAAQKPVLIAGSGLFYAHAWDALREFATRTHIPILSHIWDRGCIEQPIPEYVGVTNAELNGAASMVGQADLILTLGARIDYRLSHGRPPGFPRDARVIRVDVEPSEVQRVVVPDVGIVASPRAVLQQLNQELEHAGLEPHTAWRDQVRAGRDRLLQEWDPLGREDTWPLPGIRICREIKPFLDKEVTFLLDGGNIGRWAHMTLFDRHPSHWFTCGASGVVGWGLSGAIAARLARPDRPVLLLSGDGAAGFNVTEIETALRFGTPYVAVIAHDGAWGIVADGQDDCRRVACELGEIRFDRVAQALGAKGVYIENAQQLGPSIAQALQEDTVTVIHVPTQQAGIGCWVERYCTE